jgi:solute carrier family 50 protein (sugar transporter)
LLSLFYCVSYLKHSPKTATNLPGTAEQHKLVSFSIISFVLAAMAFLEPTAASKVVGWTSVVLSMIMYVGPLTRLRSSIAAKSARDIPLPFAIVGLVNAVAWFVYGFIVKNDVVLYAPCLIGLMSTSGQILVNLLYGKKQKLA